MNKITCPYCDSEDTKEISNLSSKEIKKLEAKIQKEIVKKEITSTEDEKITNRKFFVLFIYAGLLIFLTINNVLRCYMNNQRIGSSCIAVILFVFLIPYLLLKIKFNPKKYKKQYICNYCENIFEIREKNKNILCSKCDCDETIKMSELITDKDTVEGECYWNSIDEKAKSKMLFLESLYKKKLNDIEKTSFFYIYIAFFLPIILYVPFGLIKALDEYNKIHFPSIESILPLSFHWLFQPNIQIGNDLVFMSGYSLFDFFYVFVITITFYFLILFDYNVYLVRKKKYNSYYFCPNCQNVFIPIIHTIKLKKDTSIFTKLYLVHKKLTRKKFVNVRYISDKVKKERKKWF